MSWADRWTTVYNILWRTVMKFVELGLFLKWNKKNRIQTKIFTEPSTKKFTEFRPFFLKYFTLAVLSSLARVVCLKRLYRFFQYSFRPCILLSQVSRAIPKIRLCSSKDVHPQGSRHFLDGIQHLFYMFQPFYLYPSASVSVFVYIVTWFVVFSRCSEVVFDPYRVHGLL